MWDFHDKMLLSTTKVPAPPSSHLLPTSSSTAATEAMEAARAKEQKEAREAVHVLQMRISPNGELLVVGFMSMRLACPFVDSISS